MPITAAEVRDTRFSPTSPIGRGYRPADVDAFLSRVAQRLETGTGLNSNEVFRVNFGKPAPWARGYSTAEVDAFLDRVMAELHRQEDGDEPVETDGTDSLRP